MMFLVDCGEVIILSLSLFVVVVVVVVLVVVVVVVLVFQGHYLNNSKHACLDT